MVVLFGGVAGDEGTTASTIASRCSRLCFRCLSASAICSASARLTGTLTDVPAPEDAFPLGLKGERVCWRDLTAVGIAGAEDEEEATSTSLIGGT
ncbi:MAG: hypothetical protein ACKPKO_38020, partial [Candidatus Fonsibacter sp.]